jgi:hypothetical protein
MTTALSFEQAPPISAPFRFFVTAPFFGVAAGLVLAWQWEAVTTSRWTPQAVAVVHLMTAGFMLQVMVGALLQLMPVAVGANVARPLLVAGVVHPALTVGGALLSASFLGLGALAMQAAVVSLTLGLTVFVAVTGVALARSVAIGPTLLVLRLGVAGLAIAGGLGVALASIFAFNVPLPLGRVLDLHVAWATLGWALMLVMGVAYLVVPMFQLTPPYPTRLAKALPLALVAALLSWSLGALLDLGVASWVGVVVGVGAVVGFAVKTLSLQARRRRKVSDSTLVAWRVSMGCVLVAALAQLGLRLSPDAWRGPLELVCGVALFAGAFPAAINGMLPRIVGFIGWLHLQRLSMAAPTMQQLMPEPRSRWQLRVFIASVVELAGAARWPPLAVPGGLLFATACALMGWHVVSGVRSYRAHAARLARDAPPPS